MPTEIDGSIFNPFLLWTDLGLRAAEMTLSSSQNLSDSVDRLARAAGSAEMTDEPANDSAGARPVPFDFSAPTRFYRTWFDWGSQAWLQWMSALGSMATFATGLRAPERGRGQPGFFGKALGFDPVRRTASAAPAVASRRDDGGTRERRELHDMEHAVAAPGSKRRRSNAKRGKGQARRARAG